MKITNVRTRVVEWRGPIVYAQPHFCTSPMDILDLPTDSVRGFSFHSWLIVEVQTDAGLTGVGEAALSPRVTPEPGSSREAAFGAALDMEEGSL